MDRSPPDQVESADRSRVTAAIDAKAGEIDLNEWIRTSEALSSEIVLDKLIQALMSIAVQHAGAQRGVLLLSNNDELRLEAEATNDADAISVSPIPAAVTTEVVPESIINHVVQTRAEWSWTTR